MQTKPRLEAWHGADQVQRSVGELWLVIQEEQTKREALERRVETLIAAYRELAQAIRAQQTPGTEPATAPQKEAETVARLLLNIAARAERAYVRGEAS